MLFLSAIRQSGENPKMGGATSSILQKIYIIIHLFNVLPISIMQSRSLFLSLFFVGILISCRAQKPVTELKLASGAKLMLLDSASAAQAIVTDATDGFFEKVTPVEMSIQLKKPLAAGTDRAALLVEYTDFLKKDVAGFTPEESRWVADIWKEVGKTVGKFNKNLLPAEVHLIKTKGRHYGDGVYYTRENCIIIPQNELDARNRTEFLATMYHELFHVISRLDHARRDELYGLIGFKPIGRALNLPEELKNKMFFNPDGVDYAQVIHLKSAQDQDVMAVPVIFSNTAGGFTAKKSSFFSYLDFALFQVKQRPDGSWHLVTNPDGSSTIDLKQFHDTFFGQIGDNTQYIIHPDEVLADNFSFLMAMENDGAVKNKFSKDGQKLLEKIRAVLVK